MSTPPSLDQIRTLPREGGGTVPPEWIDQNGHMNILRYVEQASWAVWRGLGRFGAGEDYIAERGLSFFTVGQHIDYLGELREGEELAIHVGYVEQSDKALRGVAYVVDLARDRLACVFEATYVHVSMETRRAASVPEDVAAALAVQVAGCAWLAPYATGLSLQR